MHLRYKLTLLYLLIIILLHTTTTTTTSNKGDTKKKIFYSTSSKPGPNFIILFVQYSLSDLPPLRPLCGEAPPPGLSFEPRTGGSIWQGH